ncbi:MAG: glycosyltransferase family A protein [Gammaproteobacteria bacterium]|nr:glycosyltransferase family A protein [Gammaproteobacteria bacterium]
MSATVTVIVPFFGSRMSQLQRLLESLSTQDYPGPVQLIVVDNNNEPLVMPDAVPGLLLHEPDPGSYVARNAGLAAASGEIIAFTDSDCVCTPQWLSKGVTELLGGPSIGVVGGGVQPLTAADSGPSLTERYDAFFHMRQAHYVTHMGFAATANCFVRRELFTELGPFDTRFRSGGDRAWCSRVLEAGYTLAYCAEAAVHHDARQLNGLVLKSRRLAGQEWSRAQAAGGGLRSALRSDLRIYSMRVRRLVDRQEAVSVPDRLAFGAISLILETARIAELLRIRVTGASPERR